MRNGSKKEKKIEKKRGPKLPVAGVTAVIMLGEVERERGRRRIGLGGVGHGGPGDVGGRVALLRVGPHDRIVLHHREAGWEGAADGRESGHIQSGSGAHEKVPLVFTAAVHPLGDAFVLRKAIATDQGFDVDVGAAAARSAAARVVCEAGGRESKLHCL